MHPLQYFALGNSMTEEPANVHGASKELTSLNDFTITITIGTLHSQRNQVIKRNISTGKITSNYVSGPCIFMAPGSAKHSQVMLGQKPSRSFLEY